MKIGILTINDYNNYGNRLQNYALQEVLKNLGYSPLTIRNEVINDSRNILIKNLAYLKRTLGNTKKNILGKDKILTLRENNFLRFTEKYINETDFKLNSLKKVPIEMKYFDAFVIGSDQVWNYNFIRFSKYDFASFSENNQLVLSYAASFGVNDLPDEKIAEYKIGLDNLNYISVRELNGKEIVERITKRKDIQIVLDPTFLLSEEDWLKIVDESDINIDKKYVITYFLGTPSSEEWGYINKFGKKNNFMIINMNDISDPELYIADPCDFLNLIKNSEAVFTDSFHACVFAMVFKKYFEVFSRRDNNLASMNSRIDSLLTTFDLKQQYFDGRKKDKKIEYEFIDNKLESLKENSLDYLLKSLKGKR
ncbi:polysaccharide pyruvyl transferase family protein [Enterococcus casseliflavus]|uniref:polysaccharide pyruvyl transferase family protein n=1 Tax=Enterococcus casseliflavus TaxID=37734 RepID=UPI0035E0385A